MQPPITVTEKFIGFLGKIVVLRLDGDKKAFSGKVCEVDCQTGLVTLVHSDGRHSVVAAKRIAFMSEVKV